MIQPTHATKKPAFKSKTILFKITGRQLVKNIM